MPVLHSLPLIQLTYVPFHRAESSRIAPPAACQETSALSHPCIVCARPRTKCRWRSSTCCTHDPAEISDGVALKARMTLHDQGLCACCSCRHECKGTKDDMDIHDQYLLEASQVHPCIDADSICSAKLCLRGVNLPPFNPTLRFSSSLRRLLKRHFNWLLLEGISVIDMRTQEYSHS